MIRLFNDKDTYTDEALEVSDEFNKAIIPVIEKFMKKDFSIRDMSLVFINQITILCAVRLLKKNYSEKKAEENLNV